MFVKINGCIICYLLYLAVDHVQLSNTTNAINCGYIQKLFNFNYGLIIVFNHNIQ